MGYTALLIHAGLETIPSRCTKRRPSTEPEWKSFWQITMPLLRPVIILVLIVTAVGSFQVFDTVAVTTKGGPGNATRVIQLYIYDQAFGQSNFGDASAISVIHFIFLIVIAVLQFRFLRGRHSDLAEEGPGRGGRHDNNCHQARSARAVGAQEWQADHPETGAVLDGPGAGQLHHAVPVRLDAAHRAVERKGARRQLQPAPGFTGGAAINSWLSPWNCVVVATVATVGQVAFGAMAAYAFSRMRWPGRDLVFGPFLAGPMVPPIFTMRPNFVLIKQLGLLNTYPGIILPFFFMTPIAISLLRQFFLAYRHGQGQGGVRGQEHRRHAVHRAGRRQDHLPVPDLRSRSGHPTDHEAGDGQRVELLRRSSFVDRRQDQGNALLQ